jgi:SPP1 gp7 family putative phage head morphogenesis protein
MHDDVLDVLNTSYDEQVPQTEVVRRLERKSRDMREYELRRIARTEINRRQNEASYLTLTDLDVPSMRWVSQQDARVRASHAAMHGQVARVGDTFSNGQSYPTEINCRCVLEPVMDETKRKIRPNEAVAAAAGTYLLARTVVPDFEFGGDHTLPFAQMLRRLIRAGDGEAVSSDRLPGLELQDRLDGMFGERPGNLPDGLASASALNYRVVPNREGEKFLNEWNDRYAEVLTPAEVSAVDAYSFISSAPVNSALRGHATASPLTAQRISALDSAFDHAVDAPLREPITVFRATNIESLHRQFDDGTLIGSDHTDYGFISTTLNKKLAEGYGSHGDSPVTYELRLRPGQTALHPDISAGDRAELETLLPRGSRLRAVSADKDEAGRLHIVADVLPPDPNDSGRLRFDTDPLPDDDRPPAAGMFDDGPSDADLDAIDDFTLDADHRVVPESETSNFLDEWNNEYTNDLTPDEITAIDEYSFISSESVNDSLRGFMDASPLTAQRINTIDSAFDHATAAPLREPITVFRATNVDSVWERFEDGTLVGSDHTDYGYISTTLNRELAENFSSGDGSIVYELRLPSGQTALHPDISTGNRTEAEVLLPRSSRMRVISAERDENGDLQVVADVLPPDPNDSGRLRLATDSLVGNEPSVLPTITHRVMPPTEGRQFIDEWNGGYDLTRTERDAVDWYSLNGFQSTNAVLRDGDLLNASDSLRQRIDVLDKAFDTAATAPLTEPITVFRVANVGSVQRRFNDGTLIGTDHTDYGFISTSLNRQLAQEFITDDDSIIFELRLPPGQVALHPDISLGTRGELEVLLPRNSQFRFVDAKRLEDGNLHVVADVLTPDPNDPGRIRLAPSETESKPDVRTQPQSAFVDVDELDDWRGEVDAELTSEMRQSIDAVAGPDTDASRALRGELPLTSDASRLVTVTDDAMDLAADTPLPDSMTVYQTIDSREIWEQAKFELRTNDFRSVTLEPGSPGSGKFPVRLEIDLQPGQTALPVNRAGTDLLLPRGMALDVQDIVRTDNEIRIRASVSGPQHPQTPPLTPLRLDDGFNDVLDVDRDRTQALSKNPDPKLKREIRDNANGGDTTDDGFRQMTCWNEL